MNTAASRSNRRSLNRSRFWCAWGLALVVLGASGATLRGAAPSRDRDKVEPPKLMKPVEPVYPSALRDAGVEGKVDVEFNVDRYGIAGDPEVTYATHPEFANAVKAVVNKWRFSPARRDGLPIDQRVRMPVLFMVKQNDPLSKWAGRNVFKRMEHEPVNADDLGEWPEPSVWIEPYYPAELNGTGKRGEVVVSFVVDEHGDVVNPEVVVGDDPHFVASALAATVSLDFSPHLDENGDPVPVSMAVSYRFDERKQQDWDRAVGGAKPAHR